MKAVSQILDNIKSEGFKGVRPLFVRPRGHWHNEYALFELEFEQDDDELALDLCDFIEDQIGEGCEIILRDNEFEVIGNKFNEINADEYWEFPLVDDIW